MQFMRWTEPLRGRGGATLGGGVADPTIERVLDWPARFGHTWLGSGIWHRGHSSQPVAAKRDKKQKARESPRARPTADSIEASRGHVLFAFEHPWRAPLHAIFFR